MPRIITITLIFLLAQILFLLAGRSEHVIVFQETGFITIVIGVFLFLFFIGQKWARIVATILLGLVVALQINFVVEGFGLKFLGVALVNAIVIVLLLVFKAKKSRKSGEDHDVLDPVDRDIT